jgi:hypothetical protein
MAIKAILPCPLLPLDRSELILFGNPTLLSIRRFIAALPHIKMRAGQLPGSGI